MNILHITHSDNFGGAARAAHRIHRCMLDAGHNSLMWVNKAAAGDCTCTGPATKIEKAVNELRSTFGYSLARLQRTNNQGLHSPAITPSRWVKRINASNADVVHLHWVCGEMLSIRDIKRIKKPILWTLHDMWPFCGAEHYTESFRWRDGYTKKNRPNDESGFDLNRWVWERKRRHWTRPLYIVGDSAWITQCASDSVLMNGWPAECIHYPIDLDRWRPIPQLVARNLLQLRTDAQIIAFGAMGGGKELRKGFDLLLNALKHLKKLSTRPEIYLLVFGQNAPANPITSDFPITYTGHLHDDLSLSILYSAADLLVVPSRQEAFGQTASEAHACGTPVVAFRTGGLPDTVEHKKSGYLATPNDPQDLATGIYWVLNNKNSTRLRERARAVAETKFCPKKIAAQYTVAYENAISAL